MTLLLAVILAALIFEFVNGFHDTANSVAAAVGTRALSPSRAIALAAVMNLAGALAGTAVAHTVGKGLVEAASVTNHTILTALLGATIWNLVTWRLGLPSSSSHALFGSLIGAAVASTGTLDVVIWAEHAPGKPWFAGSGLLYKVILPMFLSPLLGFLVALIAMSLLTAALQRQHPSPVNSLFRRLQILSSACMGFSHGSNDAQKTMGILALALFAATNAGQLDALPKELHFLRTKNFEIALWVKLVCAATMAAGTAAGGRRIIKTLGRKVSRLHPPNGFTADITSAAVLMTAARMGMPVSTTHVVSSAIMGVGAARRWQAMRWDLVESIAWTWLLTLPASALAGYGLMRLLMLFRT
jgi:PiT family inorganic phosphate transporter